MLQGTRLILYLPHSGRYLLYLALRLHLCPEGEAGEQDTHYSTRVQVGMDTDLHYHGGVLGARIAPSAPYLFMTYSLLRSDCPSCLLLGLERVGVASIGSTSEPQAG